MKKRYFFISLLFHALILLHLTTGGDGSSQGGSGAEAGGGAPKHDEIIPKTVEIEMIEASPDKGEVPLPKEPEPKTLHECVDDHWYGGVGLEENYWDGGRISRVFSGYPAEIAGVQVGDMIESVNGLPESGVNTIRGDPGTQVTLGLNRYGVRLSLTITRDRICTEH